ALDTGYSTLIYGSVKNNLRITKIYILIFSLIVLVFSTYMSDELVLLARVSFAGTSMIAPVVLGAVIFKNPPKALIWLSTFALLTFVLSLVGVVPDRIGGYPLDFLMYCVLFILTFILMLRHHLTQKTTHEA